VANVERGGYVLSDCQGVPEAILIATGSEVELAVDVQQALTQQGRRIRVVSMPATTVFDAQPADYRESVLPGAITARVAIEAGVSDGWYKYVGSHGRVIGIDHFGESAPAGVLFKTFGFTVEKIVGVVQELL
jgi:transketolase